MHGGDSRNLFTLNIMEDSETDGSFQHELEDYIRQQRARGLQPKVCFRKKSEVSLPQGGHISFRLPVLEQQLSFNRHLPNFHTSYERQSTKESQGPLWPKAHHSRQRLEPLNNYQNKHHYFLQSSWLPSHSLSWKDCSRVHQPGYQDRCQRRQWEEDRDAASEEPAKAKRKYCERDSSKEYQGLDRKKTKIKSDRVQKSSDRKKNNQYGADTPQMENWSHRKKKRESKESPEERDLWDEAILGSCY